MPDAAEPSVLMPNAHAGVKHHRRQESRLALGKALLGDDLGAFIEDHKNSSMMLGVRPPLDHDQPKRSSTA